MAVDFSRFSNTDFNTTPFQYIIFGKNGGLLEVELNEAQYLGFIRDSIALKNIGNRCSNATITRVQNGTTTLKGDFILNGYAIHSVDTSFTTKVNDNIYAKVSLETLDKDSKVTKNGVVGGVSIDNTILDNRVQIETSKRKAIRLEINTTGGEGFVKIAYVHSKKRAVLTLDTIDLSDRFLSTIESLRYSGYLNAFDGDFTDGYYETNGGKPVPSNNVGEYHSVMTTNFIPCEPFEKIKLKHSGTLKRDGSSTSSSTFLVLFYDSDKNFLPNKCVGSGSSDTSYTFNVPSGAYYFRFNVASDNPVMSIDVVEDVTVIRHYSSQVLPNGTVVSSNADFAEVAMWSDKNPDNEDRLGYFVSVSKTEDGITITKATSTSGVRGVTISHPAFSANASDDKFENEELKKEYDYVAFAGFGTVIDNGTCTVNGRCMPDDNGCAVPSNNSMGYQVIERVDDTHVLILVEPNTDMLNRIKTDIDELNINKVDKEDGKGLFSGSYNDLSNKPPIPSKTSELENDSDFATNKSVAEEVAKIVAGAPEEFDTLKEMSDWLTQHEDSAAAMNSAISDNKTAITALQSGKADKSEIPTTLPANGGNSDTVNNHTVKSDVPENAVFTDTIYDDTEVKGSIAELSSNLSQLELSDVAGGKNLFSTKYHSKTEHGEIVINGFNSVTLSSEYWASFIINLKKNTNYTIKVNSGDVPARISAYVTNGTDISDPIKFQNDTNYLTFNSGENNTIAILLYSGLGTLTTKTFSDIQLEEGTTATPYEPYIPSVKILAEENEQQNIEAMDLKMLGWVVPEEMPIKNYVDSDGVFHQRVGRVDLGKCEWKYNGSGYLFFTYHVSNAKTEGLAVYNKYKGVTGNSYEAEWGVKLNDERYNVTYINASGYTDTTSLINAMQGVYLYYELAEEITKTIDGNEVVEELSSNLVTKQPFDKLHGYFINVENKLYYDGNTESIIFKVKKGSKYTLTNNGDRNNVGFSANYPSVDNPLSNVTLETNEVIAPIDGYCIWYVNSTLNNTISCSVETNNVGGVASEIVNINESLGVIGKCKNLLNPTLQIGTVAGVTCTANGDGTFTLNGTCTANSSLYLKKDINLKANTKVKILGAKSNALIDLQDKDNNILIQDKGSGIIYNPTNNIVIDCLVVFVKGTTYNNVIVKPMITENLNATYDDFVPYTGDGETLTHDVAELKQDLTNNYLTKEVANNTYATTGQISGLNNNITNLGTQLNSLGQNVGQLSGQVGSLSEECSNVKSSVDALKNYTVNKKAIGEINGCVLYRQVWTGIVSAVADEIINHEIGSETWGADGYITKISAYGFKQTNGVVSIKDFTNSLTFSMDTVTIHNTDEIQYNYTLIIEYALSE